MVAVVVVAGGFALTLWPKADPAEIPHAHAPSEHEHPFTTSIISMTTREGKDPSA